MLTAGAASVIDKADVLDALHGSIVEAIRTSSDLMIESK